MNRRWAIIFGLTFGAIALLSTIKLGWCEGGIAAVVVGVIAAAAGSQIGVDKDDRTIFYLIDLYESEVISSHEGQGDDPGPTAIAEAEKQTKLTGHTHTLARGVLFFQDDCEGPVHAGGVAETN